MCIHIFNIKLCDKIINLRIQQALNKKRNIWIHLIISTIVSFRSYISVIKRVLQNDAYG